MAMITIGIAATQARRAGRLASHGTQCYHLPGAQFLFVIVLTFPRSVLVGTLSEEMETVAEFAVL